MVSLFFYRCWGLSISRIINCILLSLSSGVESNSSKILKCRHSDFPHRHEMKSSIPPLLIDDSEKRGVYEEGTELLLSIKKYIPVF